MNIFRWLQLGNELLQPECNDECSWKPPMKNGVEQLLSLPNLPVKLKARAKLRDIIGNYIFK